MKIFEIITENQIPSIWRSDQTVDDPATGGMYRFLIREDTKGNIDGFSMVYLNKNINPNSEDADVVVKYYMPPGQNLNNREIYCYDFLIHSGGKGKPVKKYSEEEDLLWAKLELFKNVLKHTQQ